MLALASLGALLTAVPAGAAPRTRCFPETGYCVSGPILTYWERNGGLPTFGYPITDQHIETVEGTWTGSVQWFQRDRLEDHGPEGVLAGRLGARWLELQGRPWESFPPATGVGDPNQCRYFPETSHLVCQPFLGYWARNGGLERFGYPLTEKFQETIEGRPYWVQYFERRRMEQHPENAAPYDVLLGLLGRDVYDLAGCYDGAIPLQATIAAYRDALGCTTPSARVGVPLAVELFERGSMIWVNGEIAGRPNMIYVVFYDNARNSLVWRAYVDTWHEGDQVSGGEKPPAGLYEPIRGFGKLWRTNPHALPRRGGSGFYPLPGRPRRRHRTYSLGVNG
jgi:hypothetical protein